MANAGTITAKLGLDTAEFTSKIGKATADIRRLADTLSLASAKRFAQDIKRITLAFAEVSPEVDKAVKSLEGAVDTLMLKLAPGVELGVTAFTALVKIIDDAAEGIAFLSRMAGTLAGGGSLKEWAQDEQTRMLSASMALVPVVPPAAVPSKKTGQKSDKWGAAFEDFGTGSKMASWLDEPIATSPVATVVDRADPVAMAIGGTQVGGLVSAGAQAGPAGIAATLVSQSTGFQVAMESLAPLIQAVADSFGLLLWSVKLFEPAIKAVTGFIHKIVLGVYKALDKLPFLDYGKEIRMMEGSTKNLRTETDAATKALGSLNVPALAKVAIARSNAATSPIISGPQSMSEIEMGHGLATAFQISQVIINNPENLDEIRKELQKEAERRAYAASSRPVGRTRVASIFGDI